VQPEDTLSDVLRLVDGEDDSHAESLKLMAQLGRRLNKMLDKGLVYFSHG
jgi:hypothetical protein